MAIIDPTGLYNGDRLQQCSDGARLWWPYLFLWANGFGRFEISYRSIHRGVFSTFDSPPSEEGFLGYIEEYRNRHLLFLYQAGRQIWGQWWCKPGSLPKYKTNRDRESPEPPKTEYDSWMRSYSTETKPFPKTFRNLPKSFGRFTEISSQGIGIGIGEGDGESSSERKARSSPEQPPGLNPGTMNQILRKKGIKTPSDERQPPWEDPGQLAYLSTAMRMHAELTTGADLLSEDPPPDVVLSAFKAAGGMTAQEIQTRILDPLRRDGFGPKESWGWYPPVIRKRSKIAPLEAR